MCMVHAHRNALKYSREVVAKTYCSKGKLMTRQFFIKLSYVKFHTDS
jgi:hypothetical protein